MSCRLLRAGIFAAASTLIAWSVSSPAVRAEESVDRRWQDDLAAMEQFRPGFPFWQHVFMTPDGSIAFGSATDGRVVATFPVEGDWLTEAVWIDDSLAGTLDGAELPADLDERREYVAQLLEAQVGPVVHNPTQVGPWIMD